MKEPCKLCRGTRFRRTHDGSLICHSCGHVYTEYREQVGDPESELYVGSSAMQISGKRVMLTRISRPRKKTHKLSEISAQEEVLELNNETEYFIWMVQELFIQQIVSLIERLHLPNQFQASKLLEIFP
jgi:uncharacterized Zn finger protein (UPF0148 family)